MTPRVEVGSEEGGVAWIKSIISESTQAEISIAQKSIIRRAQRPISVQSTVTHWAITSWSHVAGAAEYLRKHAETNALFSLHPNIGIINDFILM